MADLIFAAQFTCAKIGKTGLTVTVDVDRYTISDGTRTALVTAGAATEGRRGLYHYRLASADLSLYQYITTFITTNTTVDQQEIPSLGLVVPDALVGSRLATAGYTAPPSSNDNATAAAAAILVTPANKLATGASGEASANVTMQAGVAVAAADANGNVPVVLYPTQGAVTFGQVKILADINYEGALHVENNALNGVGLFAHGTLIGQHNHGNQSGQYNQGDTYGQYNNGNDAGQYNEGDTYGQYNNGNDAGQYNEGDIPVIGVASQGIANALKLAPAAGTPAVGSVYDLLGDAALEATAQAILEDTGTTLPALLTSTLASFVNTYSTDATTAGSITRRRGDSWAIVPAALGVLTGYTSLWLTIKRSHDDADSASVLHVKKNASGLLDGLLYLNGAASTSNLASITVTDALTGVISIAVDEAATKELAPGEYYYDIQTLISGNVSTPDSGTFTVTADVTRSVT